MTENTMEFKILGYMEETYIYHGVGRIYNGNVLVIDELIITLSNFTSSITRKNVTVCNGFDKTKQTSRLKPWVFWNKPNTYREKTYIKVDTLEIDGKTYVTKIYNDDA